jgi:hypothetical protein
VKEEEKREKRSFFVKADNIFAIRCNLEYIDSDSCFIETSLVGNVTFCCSFHSNCHSIVFKTSDKLGKEDVYFLKRFVMSCVVKVDSVLGLVFSISRSLLSDPSTTAHSHREPNIS